MSSKDSRDLSLEKEDYDQLQHMTTGMSKIKKIHLTIHYTIWILLPILSVDLIRLAKTGKWLNPFYYLTLPAIIPVKIGDFVYAILAKIPVIGKPLSLIFCAPFYIYLPITRAGGFTWKEFTEKGVETTKEYAKEKGSKQAAKAGRAAGRKVSSRMEGRAEKVAAQKAVKKGQEKGSKVVAKRIPSFISKIVTRFWDDLISIPAAATVVGGIALTIIDIPFSTGTYNLLEIWGRDKKWVKAGGIRRWLVTAFLPKKYDENGEIIEDFRTNSSGEPEGFNSLKSNNQVMTDGGRDEPQNKGEFRDLQRNDDDDEGISVPFSWGTAGKAIGAVLAVFMVLIVGVVAVGGSGYGGLLGDLFGSTATSAGSGVGDLTGEASFKVQQFIGGLTCITGDAGCARELRLNMTRQPGSEDVGETYKLEVSGLEVTGAKDIRFRRPSSKIPVSFTATNTRHGTKGINAKNVQYRVKVTAPGLSKDQVVCRTGWKALNKFGSDSEVSDSRNNLILPGESVTPLSYQGEDRLSLRQCGLMNPVSGGSFRVKVQLKYDYSALSFLQLEAKANDASDTIEMTRSKTPDTPVETVIRAPNPVTYYDTQTQGTVPRPFPVRVRIATDEGSFRVDSREFILRDSGLTTHINNQCDGLEQSGEENTYEFDSEIISRIEDRQESVGWFSDRTGTPTARCNFELENPDQISETGETMTFTAQANYTVRTEEKSTSFTIRDTSCRNRNCPYVVPVDSSELQENFVVGLDLEKDKWIDYETQNWEKQDYWTKEYAICNRPFDAQPGCSYIESFSQSDRQNSLGEIDDGEMAVDMTGTYYGNNFLTCYAEERKDSSEATGVTGLMPDNIEEAFTKPNAAFNLTEGGEWTFVNDYEPGC